MCTSRNNNYIILYQEDIKLYDCSEHGTQFALVVVHTYLGLMRSSSVDVLGLVMDSKLCFST